MISHTALQWQQQDIYHPLNSQKTPHTSPWQRWWLVAITFVRWDMRGLLWGFGRKLTTSSQVYTVHGYSEPSHPYHHCYQTVLNSETPAWHPPSYHELAPYVTESSVDCRIILSPLYSQTEMKHKLIINCGLVMPYIITLRVSARKT